MNRPTWFSIIVLPLLALLLGGLAGWALRPDPPARATSVGRTGVVLPSGDALDTVAPATALTAAPLHELIDPSSVVGAPSRAGVSVPAGAALPLSKGVPTTPVDLTTMRAFVAQPVPPAPLADAIPLASVAPLAGSPDTVPPATDDTDPSRTTTSVKGAYADPCLAAATSCPGEPAQVGGITAAQRAQPGPLQLSLPFAAASGFADECATIETTAGSVPDPQLAPAMRPTIGLLLDQPATIALTGTWDDGSTVSKLTMATSPTFDAQWQTAWTTQHVQRHLLACLTLPLDVVRPHASAGVARLRVHLLAISATGRSEVAGPVTLHVPLDGTDLRMADELRVGDLGLQLQPSGTLQATVHVHYAFTSDTMVASGGLDPRTTHLYDRHAFVENADCAGWADNQQGLDRTASSTYRVTFEQRSVAGRVRPVTVVDGDVRLVNGLSAGWRGQFCTQIVAADAAGNASTLLLQGVQVRSPLTPAYSIGAAVDAKTFPSGASLSVVWLRHDGLAQCGAATITAAGAGEPVGATCNVSAAAVPGGVTVAMRVTDAQHHALGVVTVTVPINASACNPDDPYGAAAGGCATGARWTVPVPVDAKGDHTAPITIVIDRTARAGSLATAPAHEWQIGTVASFTS